MRRRRRPILDLAEADRESIGPKARRLARLTRLRPTLFGVPRGLVLTRDFDPGLDGEALAVRTEALGATTFAVRSCAADEDGVEHSLAGKYHTELHVPAERIRDAVRVVRESIGPEVHRAAVLVQEMVRPSLAGVLFSRSPGNAALASCEFSEGTAEALVSGRLRPECVEYGRWSGALFPAPCETRKRILSHVFLVGLILEEYFEAPQDVEWAYDEHVQRLFVLQCRNVTAAVSRSEVSAEQERVARLAAGSGAARRGEAVFSAAPLREVVSAPTRLTRSLIERLYRTDGALGRAFELLGLPAARTPRPYVLPVFGRLYVDREIERRVFGWRPRAWWAARRLRRRLHGERDALLEEMQRRIDGLTRAGFATAAPWASARDAARGVVEVARGFAEDVFPVAHAASMLAGLAGEPSAERSTTGALMSDLSRLHHTGGIGVFLARWGHRSADDYELSEPRFAEDPDRALRFARGFADFPWELPAAPPGFTALKELAKDRAIYRLSSLRAAALSLGRSLGLDDDEVFLLDLDDVESLATGAREASDLVALVQARRREEHAFRQIDLGDDLTLTAIERLEQPAAADGQLRGRHVAALRPFHGIARHAASDPGRPWTAGEVLVTRWLEPQLAGRFPSVAGCVADVGGALSHAAVVARELGCTVLVLPGASATIRDGDLVEVAVDGGVRLVRQRAAESRGGIRADRVSASRASGDMTR